MSDNLIADCVNVLLKKDKMQQEKKIDLRETHSGKYNLELSFSQP